ncbi:GNAT family N-acetyltransferase [Streptomyces sp. NPDC005195]|uniref:GNAT family N-acetyltransferase n=1 Tax=Streptomyces sp. NPDC005195 TaxID=3154561 RepID=UPI0033A74378
MPQEPAAWAVTHDVDAFLTRAGDFLRSRPALHTVPLTVTHALRTRGPSTFGTEAPVLGLLERDGEVRAAFFRTPPHRLNVTPLSEEDADSLAARLADLGHDLPGVTADRATAAAFAEAWQRHRAGVSAPLHRHDRLYRLDTPAVPGPVPPGRPRIAEDGDRGLLARWYGEFAEAVGERTARVADDWAAARIAHGGITLWEAPDGTPVAMAGATPRVAGQVRVGPVYTPAPFRGRGYAGAATVEVGRAALASGVDDVLLFTDLSNPTSNGLYQRIGYRPVADFDVYDFEDASRPAATSASR